MEQLTIVKIGGNVLDDEEKLSSFLRSFCSLKGRKILVHGGGQIATEIGEKLGIKSSYIGGRRVTDADTLDLVTMVYAGLINKKLVVRLQHLGCNAIGLCGADGNMITAHRRKVKMVDYGFVGDIVNAGVNSEFLKNIIDMDMIPVIAPLSHDGHSSLLNTSADTIATELAKAMGELYQVKLIFCYEKAGLLSDPQKDDSVIEKLDIHEYSRLKEGSQIAGGMLPKLENAFAARASNVNHVVIGHSDKLVELSMGIAGTRIV